MPNLSLKLIFIAKLQILKVRICNKNTGTVLKPSNAAAAVV